MIHTPGTWNNQHIVDWEPSEKTPAHQIFATNVDCNVCVINAEVHPIHLSAREILVMHFEENEPDHWMILPAGSDAHTWYTSYCECCGKKIIEANR
jgi:hypothetical protein